MKSNLYNKKTSELEIVFSVFDVHNKWRQPYNDYILETQTLTAHKER